MPLDGKSFDLDVFGFQKPQTWGSFQIEAFSIQGHDPRMLKVSNSKSWGPKTSNSKVLKSWAMPLDGKSFDLDVLDSQTSKPGGHAKSKLLVSIQGMGPGWEKLRFQSLGLPQHRTERFQFPEAMSLDGKRFDLGWPPGLEVLGSKNIQIEVFYHPNAWPQDVKTFEFEVLGLKNIEFEGFNILRPYAWMLIASIWDCPPVWRFGNSKTFKRRFFHSGAWSLPGC